jgi:RNA polymerase sigma-70 factor, ECF subfamily
MTNQVRKERFMALYEPVHLSFQRFCSARTRTGDDAKDLISETVLIAYRGIDTLRDDKAFLAYLFGIASRLLKKEYRREKFWGLFDLKKSEGIAASGASAETHVDLQILYEAISKLPRQSQDAVVLHHISGFSLAEVAEIQNCSLSAVKVRVMRERVQLKSLLQINDEAVKKENIQELLK